MTDLIGGFKKDALPSTANHGVQLRRDKISGLKTDHSFSESCRGYNPILVTALMYKEFLK